MVDWQQFKDGVFTAVYRRPDKLSGLVAFEQIAFRSAKEKRCHACGEPGTHYYPPGQFMASTGYYLCDDCNTHFNGEGR